MKNTIRLRKIKRGTKKGKRQQNDERYGIQVSLGEEELRIQERATGHGCNLQHPIVFHGM